MKNRMWQVEALTNYLWFAPLFLAVAVALSRSPWRTTTRRKRP